MSELSPSKETVDTQKPANGSWGILEKLANKYDEDERSRVDKIKDAIEPSDFSENEGEQIGAPPKLIRKISRLVMDRLGIHFSTSERRRDREATSIALKELQEERAQKEEAERLAEEQERQERERREEEKRLQEQESLEKDMQEARDALDGDKKDRFRKQRAQEILERDLNGRLLKVSTLEDEIIAENPEVSKRTIEYEGKEIVVYDLKGIPFRMLSHDINYKDKPDKPGYETAQKITENPEEWTKPLDEVKKFPEFGGDSSNARGNTICTAYSDSDSHIAKIVGRNPETNQLDLVYGFDHVDSDSILQVSIGDGFTGNIINEPLIYCSYYDYFKKPHSSRAYHEVTLRRYYEAGIPKKPDYIIAENGEISEAMLKHAKFFGIPIINIQTGVYEKKQLEKTMGLMNSISESDGYEELSRKIEKIFSMDSSSVFRFYPFSIIGNPDARNARKAIPENEKEEIGYRVMQLEIKKRIDFIEETMKKFIEQIKDAIKNGTQIPNKPDGFESFSISLIDLKSGGDEHTRDGIDHSLWSESVSPGNCNRIRCNFRFKDSSREVETWVDDGEHPLDPEEAIRRGTRKKEDFESADSSYYERIAPLVLEYFSLLEQARKTS